MKYSLKYRTSTITFKAVRPDDVMKIIQGLKNSKSTGTDFIETWIIKLVAGDILVPLTNIINLSIDQAKFPVLWKHAKVVPLLKKDDHLSPKITACGPAPSIQQNFRAGDFQPTGALFRP